MNTIDYRPFEKRVRQCSPSGFDEYVAGELPLGLSKAWRVDYRRVFRGCRLVWIDLNPFTYIFDVDGGRVLAAYGCMNGAHSGARHSKRAQHPFNYDRKADNVGHIMPHSGGGGLDINLFLQLAKVNNGAFKSLEMKAVRSENAFYFVRLLYSSSGSDRPSSLEQGLAMCGPPPAWWDASFPN